VAAAMKDRPLGLIDNWLRHIQDVHRKHAGQLVALPNDQARLDRLCELNVIEQAANVCETSIIRQAWESGRDVAVMGWIYGLQDGLLRDIGFSVQKTGELADAYRKAIVTPAPR